MPENKKQKEQPQSPLADLRHLGVKKEPINGEKKNEPISQREPEPDPVLAKEVEPAQPEPEAKASEKRRITAYVLPDIYKWAKHRAVSEDRDLSAIVEAALRLYKEEKDSGSK